MICPKCDEVLSIKVVDFWKTVVGNDDNIHEVDTYLWMRENCGEEWKEIIDEDGLSKVVRHISKSI